MKWSLAAQKPVEKTNCSNDDDDDDDSGGDDSNDNDDTVFCLDGGDNE